MTENDLNLIKEAHYMWTNEDGIRAMIQKADSQGAKIKLEELADEAFRIHERIAFEIFD